MGDLGSLVCTTRLQRAKGNQMSHSDLHRDRVQGTVFLYNDSLTNCFCFFPLSPSKALNCQQGSSPWTAKTAKEIKKMRKRRRKQKRTKERAFGQSTETVGENELHRWDNDIQSLLSVILKQIPLALLLKGVRFHRETSLWSHITLRCFYR